MICIRRYIEFIPESNVMSFSQSKACSLWTRVGLHLISNRLWDRASSAPTGRQTGDVVLLLDGHRQAEQRPLLALRQGFVGRLCRDAGALEIAHHDGVDLPVERFDAADRRIDQLARRELTRRQRIRSSIALQ